MTSAGDVLDVLVSVCAMVAAVSVPGTVPFTMLVSVAEDQAKVLAPLVVVLSTILVSVPLQIGAGAGVLNCGAGFTVMAMGTTAPKQPCADLGRMV